MVEQLNSDGGTVVQCWWNSVMVQWKSDGGTVWYNSGTVIVEQCCRTVEQWNSDGGTVSDGRTVEQCWWNGAGGTVKQYGGTLER